MHTSLIVLNHVLAAGSAGSSGGSSSSSKGSSGLASIGLLLVLFMVAYFVFLRPARNRQRAAVDVRRNVEVGDEITTTAGLIANVVAVDDDYLTLEIAPGVHCRYVPAAVLRVNRDDDEYETDDEDDDHDESDHGVSLSKDSTASDVPEQPVIDSSQPGTTETPEGNSPS